MADALSISEMIKRLEVIKEEHGDIDVYVMLGYMNSHAVIDIELEDQYGQYDIPPEKRIKVVDLIIES